jgi:hypothetical protein
VICLLTLVRADASQHEWFACNGVAVHAASRAPLNKALCIMLKAWAGGFFLGMVAAAALWTSYWDSYPRTEYAYAELHTALSPDGKYRASIVRESSSDHPDRFLVQLSPMEQSVRPAYMGYVLSSRVVPKHIAWSGPSNLRIYIRRSSIGDYQSVWPSPSSYLEGQYVPVEIDVIFTDLPKVDA